MGIGAGLYICAQDAVRAMIEALTPGWGLSRNEAYVLCSVAVDLRIGEIVDAPNHVVTASIPMSTFE